MYSIGFLPIQERDGDNNVVREYVWGPSMGGGIGGLLAMKENGSTYYYLYDGKGNVTALTDSNGNVVATYTYNPFGVLTEETGTLDQPFRFSTKRYDEQTGLSYYGYRWYSASLGRWMTRDPLGEAGGMNLYGFVGNDSINGIDPLGLAYVAAYARKRGTNGSTYGHSWIKVTNDDGTSKTVGTWMDEQGPAYTDQPKIGDAMYVWKVSQEAADAALNAIDKPGYEYYNDNCTDRVEDALDAAGINHPSFNHLIYRISDPNKVYKWLMRLSSSTEPTNSCINCH